MNQMQPSSNGNLFFGVVAGLVAAVFAAVVWAAITAATNFQIGYMSIAVGFMVAFAMRFAGRGHDRRFGYSAAILAVFGCLLGNFFAACAQVAHDRHLDVFFVVQRLLPHFFEIIKDTFSGMDLLFYAIGAYFGYKYAIAPPKSAATQQPVQPPPPQSAQT